MKRWTKTERTSGVKNWLKINPSTINTFLSLYSSFARSFRSGCSSWFDPVQFLFQRYHRFHTSLQCSIWAHTSQHSKTTIRSLTRGTPLVLENNWTGWPLMMVDSFRWESYAMKTDSICLFQCGEASHIEGQWLWRTFENIVHLIGRVNTGAQSKII